MQYPPYASVSHLPWFKKANLHLLGHIRRASRKNGFTFESNKFLGANWNYSGRTVQRHLDILKRSGLVLVVYSAAQGELELEFFHTIRCIIPVGSGFSDGIINSLKLGNGVIWFSCRSPKTNQPESFLIAWRAIAMQERFWRGSAERAGCLLHAADGFNSLPSSFERPGALSPKFYFDLSRDGCLWGHDKSGLLNDIGSQDPISSGENAEKHKAPSPRFDAEGQVAPALPPDSARVDDDSAWLKDVLTRLLPSHSPDNWNPADFRKFRALAAERSGARRLLTFLAGEPRHPSQGHTLLGEICGIQKLARFAKPIVQRWREKNTRKHREFRSGCYFPPYEDLEKLWINAHDLTIHREMTVEEIIHADALSYTRLICQLVKDLSESHLSERPGAKVAFRGEYLWAAIIRLPRVWRYLLYAESKIDRSLFLKAWGFDYDALRGGVEARLEYMARDLERLQEFRFLDDIKNHGFCADFDPIPDPAVYRTINVLNISCHNCPDGLSSRQAKVPTRVAGR